MPEMMEQEQQTGAGDEQEFLFDAFISYRHAELDSAAAGYLQKALEHYRVPREIRKKCGKKSLGRIFRDEEELGAASDLFGEIEQNLRRSEFLLVICTPRLLESKWCMREIETFIRYRGRENVLAVLVEGEPETAFPPILLEAGEPLAADIRGKNKREVLRRARERMPRLAAPLLHCTYDELYQRHRVYRMHRMLAAAGVVTALSLGFGAVTVVQNMKITENLRGKLENQSKYLASLSVDLLKQGDREAALLVAMEALPKSAEDTSRPYVAEARVALEQALYTYAGDYRYNLRPQLVMEHKGTLGSCSGFDEEENVILTSDTRAYVWDAETGEQLLVWGDDGREYTDAKLAAGHRLLMRTLEAVLCIDYRSGELLWEWQLPGCVENCSVTTSGACWDYCRQTGTILFTTCIQSHYMEEGPEVTDRHRLHLIDLETGQSRTWEPEGLFHDIDEDAGFRGYLFPVRAVLSPDGRFMAIAWQETAEDAKYSIRMIVLPVDGDEVLLEQLCEDNDYLDHLSWLPDGDLVVVNRISGGGASLMSGMIGQPRTWRLTCWNMETREPWFRYEDTSLALLLRIVIESVPANPEREGSRDLLTVICDNVEVDLDRYTGECYTRLEDRSPFVLCHVWDSSLKMLITADGYVFTTTVGSDSVYSPKLSAYHYYLDQGYIPQAEWHDDNVYLYTETAVYRYRSAVDWNFTMLERAPRKVWFSGDHSAMLLMDYNDDLKLFTTDGFDRRWKEPLLNAGIDTAAALTPDDWAVYLPQSEDGRQIIGVVFRAIADDRQVTVPIEDFPESGTRGLAAAGASRAALWNNDVIIDYRDPELQAFSEEKLARYGLWLADAGAGEVIRRWSCRELYDAVPIPEAERPESWYLKILSVRASASGRYLLIPARVTGGAISSGFEEMVLLVWDLTEDRWVDLPPEAGRGLVNRAGFDTFYEGERWTSPAEDTAVLCRTGENGTEMMVLDLAAGAVARRWTVEGVGSREVAFAPDGDHLVFQDGNRRFRVYDWKEGKYTAYSITPENGSMRFDFAGDMLFAYIKPGSFYSETCNLYLRLGPGNYRKETDISKCSACDGNVVVLDDNEQSRLYHYYQLDDLLAQAKEILNGRELTDVERENYLID